MKSSIWVVVVALAIAPFAIAGCQSDSGAAGTSIPDTEAEGATEEVEREHPALERTEQPVPPTERPGLDDDDLGIGGPDGPAMP